MMKINDLIKSEKVDWIKLSDLLDYEQPTKYIVRSTEYNDSFNTPVLTAGKTFILGYTDETTGIYPASNDNPVIIFDDFTTGNHWVDFKFKVKSSAMKILKPKNENVNLRYCYHYIQTIKFDVTEHKRVWISKFSQIEIPIPSIETQQEIVNILDKFTKCVTELQAELQAREKQYSYYRDKLLSEDYLTEVSKLISSISEKDRLRVTTLGEIGKFTRGNGLQKKNLLDSGNPVIHYGQIFTKYGFSTKKTFSYASDDIFSRLRKAKINDILIATTSENIKDVGKSVVWLGEQEVGFSGDMYSYSTEENSKYIAYFLQSNEFQRVKEQIVTGTKVIRIHGSNLEKVKIVLPSRTVQDYIVGILDKFIELTRDIKQGLPKEIKLRKRQYEYYRDKLLDFPKQDVESK